LRRDEKAFVGDDLAVSGEPAETGKTGQPLQIDSSFRLTG
jgi:hypothetical protein